MPMLYKKISSGFVPYCEKCGRPLGVVYDTALEAELCEEYCHHCSSKTDVYHHHKEVRRTMQANKLFRLIDITHDFVEAGRQYGYTGCSSQIASSVKTALRRCGWRMSEAYGDDTGCLITHWWKDGKEKVTETILSCGARRLSRKAINKLIDMRIAGASYKALSEEFGISSAYVGKIIKQYKRKG